MNGGPLSSRTKTAFCSRGPYASGNSRDRSLKWMTIVKCSIYNFREVCNLDISTIIKKDNNEVRHLWVSEANYVILLFIKFNELHTQRVNPPNILENIYLNTFWKECSIMFLIRKIMKHFRSTSQTGVMSFIMNLWLPCGVVFQTEQCLHSLSLIHNHCVLSWGLTNVLNVPPSP